MKDLGKSSAVSKKASVPLIGNNNRYKTIVEVQSHKYINSPSQNDSEYYHPISRFRFVLNSFLVRPFVNMSAF